MYARVKIRGIYSTALTHLLLDSGFAIVDPSPEIQERFGLRSRGDEVPDVVIQDRENRQGVDLLGETERVWELLSLLQARLVDAALLGLEPLEDSDGLVRARVEFPGAAKEVLDKVRSAVAPTLARHHRLRIIDRRGLQRAEREILEPSEKKERLEKKIFLEAILVPLQKASVVRLEHVRVSGRRVRPREGLLVEATAQRIVVQRFFSRGRYEGLDLPIEDGDYALTEIREGAWSVKHSYYSRDGGLKGEYCNVNTPVEIYPHGARYVDLEVDVVRRAGERPFLVDREKLVRLAREGAISSALEQKAMEVAQGLMRDLGG